MYRLEEYIMLEHDDVEDKDYLLNLEDGVMFELNASAKMMLECIIENGNCDAYINKVVSEFGVGREKVENDCAVYISSLIEKKCICKD